MTTLASSSSSMLHPPLLQMTVALVIAVGVVQITVGLQESELLLLVLFTVKVPEVTGSEENR